MKVNMTPNPLDVVTIHASQGDTEARQWEFELHNNGELIDTSSVTEQLFFKAYKGGTEQLLPENGSTPTTSPIIADIKYPQGLLTDQEFTYRQSPTEEDGLAKITDIKGNTLVWNQLVQNGNFVSADNWAENQGTKSADNNVLTLTITSQSWSQNIAQPNKSIIANHKYLMAFDIESSVITHGVMGRLYSSSVDTRMTMRTVSANAKTRIAEIITPTQSYTANMILYCCFQNSTESNGLPVGATVKYSNVILVDLTQMGLDSLTLDEITSLFNLPYYAYNQGTLLSFIGNGIKTVGKNRLNYDAWKTVGTRNGTSVWENNGVTITATGNDAYTQYGESSFPVNARIPVRVGETITLSWESDDNVNGDVYIFPNGGSAGFVKINNRVGKSLSYTPIDGVEYVTIRFGVASSGNTIHFKNIMVRYDGADSTFEPYTSSTLSLPISTYFPTGMKSAGNVYDELTETKAITRIGSRAYQSGDEDDTSVITDGTTTYYALATPIETEFTTASLVTENEEIPLSNEDGVLIGKCTEQLSSESGFFDAKIKLADEDGECYSNKIQLHIERSPQ